MNTIIKKLITQWIVILLSIIAYCILTVDINATWVEMDCFLVFLKTLFVIFNLGVGVYLFSPEIN